VPDEMVSFAAVEPLAPAESRRVGRWVERPCPVVFRADKYPDKNFELTPEELREAVGHFERNTRYADFDMEHVPTLLDKKLGGMTKLRVNPDGKTFSGVGLIPSWFDDEFRGKPIPVSAQFDRKTKRIKGFALTCDPRLDGTELLASFSVDMAGNGPMPPPPADGGDGSPCLHGNDLFQKVYDLVDDALSDATSTSKQDVYSAGYVRMLTKMRQMAVEGGATENSDQDASEGFSNTGGGGVATDQTAEFTRLQAEFDRLRETSARQAAQIADMRKKAVAAEAVAFARSDPVRRRVLPEEEADLSKATSHLEAFKNAYLKRKEHGLTTEAVRGHGSDRRAIDASFTTPPPVRPGERSESEPPTPERRRELLLKTEYGRKIIAEEDARKNGQAATV
jgi:hypothetical protein